jgi:nicotinate-nucleotide adenylyltransferase
MRLGLLGGTFDPIHLGHLLIAEVARWAASLDRVVFVPAGDPPHKGEAVSAAVHRYEMALLATADHPYFDVSRREIARTGPSYSLLTVQEYRDEMADGGELYFIVGADALREIRTWHRWEELLLACRFLAVARPGSDLAEALASLPPSLQRRVERVQAPGYDLSATEVRRRVWDGEPIRYLVPPSVELYIQKHSMYQNVQLGSEHLL